LIVYGTTEGHTRHLSQFVQQVMEEAAHEVTVAEAGPAAPDPDAFDLIVLAASLHVGSYQAALIDYARRHHDTLNSKPSAFISVSLSAAGENPDEWEGLKECAARFEHQTSWTPRAVHHAAGAIRYSQYDFFKRLALKFIAKKRGKETVTTRDYDLTDYGELQRFAIGLVEGIK
jgi:menaquinone-dependent protoporphyrinogen oxidase